MQESLKNTLKEEFPKAMDEMSKPFHLNLPTQIKITNWWLSRIDSLLDQKKREIEGLEKRIPLRGNRDLIDRDDVLKIIDSDI